MRGSPRDETRALHVIGAGGHAKVVIATARAAGFQTIEVADDNAQLWGSTILGARVTGPVAAILERTDAIAVLAIGENATRARLGKAAHCQFVAIVHPSAVVESTVEIGIGTVVFAGTVIQPDTRLGAHVIVNTGASIDHDNTIGDAAHLAPGSRLAGNVTVGEGALIGIGAVVIPGRSIGAWSRVGAGAAVIRDVAPGATVVGVPARTE
jgi:sugar O-acyltransferase (sialic acid O-acetyltransferase NeuD family)